MRGVKNMLPCGREHVFHGFASLNSAHFLCFFSLVVFTSIVKVVFCWDEPSLRHAARLFAVFATHVVSLSHSFASVLSLFVPPGSFLSLLVNFGEEIVRQ